MKNMKRIFCLILVMMVTSVFLPGCGSTKSETTPVTPDPAETSESDNEEVETPSSAVEPSVVIQLGHCDASSDDNGYQIYAVLFRDHLEELSGGQMSVEIYGDSILGGERDLMEGMNLGTIEMSIVSNMYVSNFVQDFQAFDLPYIFTSYQHAKKVFSNEAIVGDVFEKLYTTNNSKILSTGTIGFRHVINTIRPIEHVSDLEGMKIRVPETPILVGDFTAFGANCTTTAWSEAFTAVQQKTVDGLEVTTSAIYTGRFWEICKYMSLTSHMYQPLHLMISSSYLDTLTDAQISWVEEAAKLAASEQVDKIEAMEQGFLDEMDAAGCTVNSVDLDEFKAATAGVYEEVRAAIGDELVDAVIAEGEK